MPLSQELKHLLKVELITLRDLPPNPNTHSPKYNPNVRCAYHSNSLGHDTNGYWSLKNKIQDMIDTKEIEFDPPETPNVITSPMPKHDKGINSVDYVAYFSAINDLTAPLLITKKNLLKYSLFSGCIERCYCYTAQSNGCKLLKEGIQRLMDNHIILVEKTPFMENLFQDLELEDVSVIYRTSIRITAKGPVKIKVEPVVTPLIITAPRPIPYSSDKAIHWNYEADVYYHGVKQEPLAVEDENT